ncbi:RlpA-like double-psi beta-barrel domain-containing protein [Rhodotorula paludigena]|uniref:RlpA-like double-psi beta-barrel domain-containing protein n=1 Tax=Rhodotorula paludigena TaxID=86838 RepID=UPI003172C75A
MYASAALLALAGFASVQAAPVSLAVVEAALSNDNSTQYNQTVVDYHMNGNAGACGWYSKDSDVVVGLPLEFYSDLGVVSPYCGDYVVVVDPRNNNTVTALVADASTANDTLSLSQGTWNALNGTDSHLELVNWRFANETETEAAKEAHSSGSSSVPSSTSYAAPASTSSAAAEQYQAPSSSSSSARPTTTTEAYREPSTTSYAPKTTTTSYKPKTTTTTTQKAAETTAAVQQSYKESSSSSSNSYSGSGTYFYQNGNAGNCGSVHSDSDYIIALESSMYGSGGHCGQSVTISHGGKSIQAKVADSCPSCVSSTSIDLSEGAFQALAPLSAGMIDVTWHFN